MPKIAHFIFTRYNVGLYDDWRKASDRRRANVKRRHRRIGSPERWMKQRFVLFRRFCAPSIQYQLNKDFFWVLAMDSRTPAADIKAIVAAAKCPVRLVMTAFRAARGGHGVDYKAAIKTIVAETATKYSHLLTSRVDNDDAVREDFVQLLQDACYRNTKPRTLDFRTFFRMEANSGVTKQLSARQASPFVSYLEPWRDKLTTVMCRSHNIWTVDEFVGDQCCIAVCHERNVTNAMPSRGVLASLPKGFHFHD